MFDFIEDKKIKDLDSLNEFLKPYGLFYDPHEDVFYTRIDAWQREMGFTRLYDEAAAPSFMILDSEPIYFNYDNKRAGYRKKELMIIGKTVSLIFPKPKSPQPFTRTEDFDEIIQDKNKALCHKYNDLTKDYDNTLDKLIALQEIAPDMVKKVLLMGKTKDIFKL